MRVKNLSFSLLFSCLFLPLTVQAFFSPSVNRAMDEAKICNKVTSNHGYIECMNKNNQALKRSIDNTTTTKTADYSPSKQKRVKQYVKKQNQSITKNCLNEKSKLGNGITSDRRHIYCVYENLLELQINLERNIELYAK